MLGSIATAIVLPQGGTLMADSSENIYLLAKLPADKPFVWYAGAGWSGAGDFVKAEYWNTHVAAFAAALRVPLKVTVK